jgi:glycosyltransferase involved in cell wall biosynthesis
MEESPLVSCIMPTYNRRRFVPKAVEYFRRQDYPNKELIIIDDGTDPIHDLLSADPRIRYLQLDQKTTIGAKRNLACKEAAGEIIVHWDDDDWMAPHRISYQMEGLLEEKAEVCGLRHMLFHDLTTGTTWLYQYPSGQRLWLAGGSLMYRRDFWHRSPFPNIQVGEDARFMWNKPPKRAAALSDYGFYVAMIHTGNTSPKKCLGQYWTRWSGDLRLIMDKDLDFYRSFSDKSGTDQRDGMKLNLGCCDAPLPGFINVDMIPAPGIEVVDLRETWPWGDNSVKYIRAFDIIEHLPEKIFTMNEMWRVLQPGGRAEIAVPTTDGPGAWQDPTHVSFWNRRSFLYYEAGNPYRERFARHYGIRAKFKIVQERTDQTQDGPRLTMLLEAVKR